MDIKKLQVKLSKHTSELLEQGQYVKYGVMVPVIQNSIGKLQILFEKRAATLRGQPGEICFPGGRFEDADLSAWETAKRETAEELGVDPGSVHFLGELDYIINHSRRIIYPFVGYMENIESCCPNPGEVEEIYLIDLEELKSIEPEFHHITLRAEPSADFPFHLIPNGAEYAWRNGQVTQPFYQIKDLVIWGLTARILHHFLQVQEIE
jgi:8-oxo-dGTP pyrophosphatase MutT (NUDIX family)